MDVRKLILATLAAEAGCGSTWGCESYREEGVFSLDAALSPNTLDSLGPPPTSPPDRVQEWCETACFYSYEEQQQDNWQLDEIEHCEHTFEPGDTAAASSGSVTCDGTTYQAFICEGRRPLGHVEAPGLSRTVGEHLAHTAHLEAASVVAFLQLVRQLTALGAPADSVARCRRAAAEEVVHARLFAGLARQQGASVPPLHQEPAAEDLLAIALHNATEGCVGETWAVLQAQWQAQHSPDPHLRRVFSRIANDEAGHAQLAWDLHAWLLTRLDPDQKAIVRAAQHRALAALPALAQRQSAASPGILGLPSPTVARSLAARFAAQLAA